MQKFIDTLYLPDDLLEIRLLPSKRRQFERAGNLPEHLPGLLEENEAGQNVHIGANPRRRQGGKAADVALARSVFVDVENIGAAAARQRIEKAGLPTPTVLLNSGHGAHAYWLLDVPIMDLAEWTRAQKHLIRLLGSDPAIHDPPRLMRLPGFTNHKPPAAQCALIDADGSRRYALADLLMQQREQSAQRSGENGETQAIASVLSAVSVPCVLSASLLHQAKDQIEQAVALTVPTTKGQRHRQVFQLARALKAIPQVAELPAGALKPVAWSWHQRALKVSPTPFDETWTDFVNGWGNVRYALGESPMDTIMETLKGRQPPREAGDYETPQIKLLVALCAELQRQAGSEPFYLDSRTAGRTIGAEAVTAWRWMNMLEADDLLEEVETGRPGRATRWRWKGRPDKGSKT